MPPKHAVLRGLARTSSSFLTTNASLQTRKTCSAIDPSVGGFSSHRVTQTHAHTPRALSVSFSVEWPASYAQPRRRQRETKRKREKERRRKRRGRVAERERERASLEAKRRRYQRGQPLLLGWTAAILSRRSKSAAASSDKDDAGWTRRVRHPRRSKRPLRTSPRALS